MKIFSLMNLKGGVAKTISAINIAYILAEKYDKKVLLIDNDKQANTSRFFGVFDEEKPSLAHIINKTINIIETIQSTDYENIDLIQCTMEITQADINALNERTLERYKILSEALEEVRNDYDFCVIDNAPDTNTSVLNALSASDWVLVPIKADAFALDGLKEIIDQVNNIKSAVNSKVKLKGCFITQYQNNKANQHILEELKRLGYPVLKSIRRSIKVDESTIERKPILEFSRNCGASIDYKKLVEELLGYKK